MLERFRWDINIWPRTDPGDYKDNKEDSGAHSHFPEPVEKLYWQKKKALGFEVGDKVFLKVSPIRGM